MNVTLQASWSSCLQTAQIRCASAPSSQSLLLWDRLDSWRPSPHCWAPPKQPPPNNRPQHQQQSQLSQMHMMYQQQQQQRSLRRAQQQSLSSLLRPCLLRMHCCCCRAQLQLQIYKLRGMCMRVHPSSIIRQAVQLAPAAQHHLHPDLSGSRCCPLHNGAHLRHLDALLLPYPGITLSSVLRLWIASSVSEYRGAEALNTYACQPCAT